jgi:hypothetical protein
MWLGARVLTDEGREYLLAPEALVGRATYATLRIDDPRVSEAHAIVSLRGAELKLLGLRGRMSVDGKPRADVTLAPGVRVVLAGWFGITVVAVSLPEDLLAILPDDDALSPLAVYGVVSFFAPPHQPLMSGFFPEALAHAWTSGDKVILRDASGDASLDLDQRFEVGGCAYTLVATSRAALEVVTTSDRGRFDTRLLITLHFDAAHVTVPDGRSVALDGLAARALSELHAIGQPVSWTALSAELWPELEAGGTVVRQRWDQLMTRTRMKLREAGIRSDLIRSSRHGLVELVLGPSDQVDDRS